MDNRHGTSTRYTTDMETAMRTRTFLMIACAAATLLSLLNSGSALAQSSKPILPDSFNPRMNTVVDNVVGLGDSAPQARIILRLEEDDLCLFIAIPPDPKQLHAGLFKFKRKRDGESKLETLKFKVPKKPVTREGEKVKIWETCLEDIATEQAAATEIGDTFIEMSYRDPRPYAKPTKTVLNHPLGTLPIGVDVHKDSGGSLSFSFYDAAAELRAE